MSLLGKLEKLQSYGNVAQDWSTGNLVFNSNSSSAQVAFGANADGLDAKFFGATTGAFMLWDESGDALIFDKADIQLGDTDFLKFGDASGGDVSINWTGAILQISPAEADTGSINIGNGTKDIDLKVFLGSANEYVLFDVGNSLIDIAGVPLSCPDGNTSKFIETGTYSSETDKGIILSATNNRPVSFLFDDGTDIIASGDVRGVLSRVAIFALHTGALTLDAIRGHVKFVGGVDYDADYVSGVRGYLEIAGATDFGLNAAGHAAAALHARVEVAGNVSVQTAGSYLAGLFIELNTTGAYSVTQTGVLAGVVIEYTDQKNDKWGHGLYIADGACDTGITINSCADGITQLGTIVDFLNIGAAATVTNFVHFNAVAGCVVANALVPAAAPDAGTMGADAAIVCDIGGTPYYIPLYNSLHA